jgi:hypothetical protein
MDKEFRDNRVFGFLYRPIGHMFVALPMNIIFFYIVGNFFAE